MRPSATSVWGLQLLVYEAVSYQCTRPSATSACGLQLQLACKRPARKVHVDSVLLPLGGISSELLRLYYCFLLLFASLLLLWTSNQYGPLFCVFTTAFFYYWFLLRLLPAGEPRASCRLMVYSFHSEGLPWNRGPYWFSCSKYPVCEKPCQPPR
jgi:hypothetical protein